MARTTARLLAWAACSAAALTASATCGGGGGGGGGGAAANPYKAQWSTWEDALKRGTPILLYYQTRPSEQSTLCCTKAAQELSKQYSFVKIPYAKTAKEMAPVDQELLKAYAFERKPALAVVLDPFGNELGRVSAGLTEPKLTPLFEQAKKDTQALEDRLAKQLAKARASDEKGETLKAVQGYRAIAEYRGCPPALDAGKALKALFDRMRRQIEGMLVPEADPAAGLKTLQGWQKDCKGTELEEAIRDAVKNLQGRHKAP